MNDERRDAAERWAVEQWGWMGEEDAPIRRALADGYLAGQECGEQRAAEKIAELEAEIARLRKLVRWRNYNTRATVLSMPDDVVGAFMRALKEQP